LVNHTHPRDGDAQAGAEVTGLVVDSDAAKAKTAARRAAGSWRFRNSVSTELCCRVRIKTTFANITGKPQETSLTFSLFNQTKKPF